MWSLWDIALYVGILLALYLLWRSLSTYSSYAYYNKAYHLVILTYNSQQHIEWTVISYRAWNEGKEKKGAKGHITCIDTGSTDDTLAILERLQQRTSHLQIIRISALHADEAIKEWLESQKQNKEKLIVLDMRNPDTMQESSKSLA